MIRVAVIYNKTDDTTFDYDYYVDSHMPMAQREFSAKKWEVDKILETADGSPSPIHCIGYLYFDSPDQLKTAMTEEAAGKVMGDVPNYYTGGSPVVLVSEVVG